MADLAAATLGIIATAGVDQKVAAAGYAARVGRPIAHLFDYQMSNAACLNDERRLASIASSWGVRRSTKANRSRSSIS